MSVEEFVFHITGQTKTKIRNTSVVIVELRNVRANAHHMRMCRTTIVMNFPGHKFRAIPHKKNAKLPKLLNITGKRLHGVLSRSCYRVAKLNFLYKILKKPCIFLSAFHGIGNTLEVAFLYYPYFGCLASYHRIIGALMGLPYAVV